MFRRSSTVIIAVITAFASLAPAHAAPAATASGGGPEACAVPTVDDLCETWVAPFAGGDSASAGGLVSTRPMAVAPDGRRVFVVGAADNVPGGDADRGAVTVAQDAADGRRLWTSRHDGPAAGSDDRGIAVAVSPSGDVVYSLVSSFTQSACSGAVLAHDAATGAERWRWQGSCHSSLDVAPDGSTLYLAGGHRGQMAVTAIAATEMPGTLRWTATAPVERENDSAYARVLAVSPDGDTVYLGGAQYRDRKAADMTIAAVRTGLSDATAAGKLVWIAHDPITEPDNFYPRSGVVGLAVSPDGTRVFATGDDDVLRTTSTDGGMLTYAHDAATGGVVWSARHTSPEPLKAGYKVGPGNLAVSPDGQRVFVTGLAGRPLWDGAQRQGPATVAYDAGDGTQLWAVESSLPAQAPYYLGTYAMQSLSADGATVYVTSVTSNPGPQWRTMAHSATTGGRRWSARYGTGRAFPHAVVASPTGDGVFVAGTAKDMNTCAALVCAPTPFPDKYRMVTVRYDG